jgi:hypothetical protein
MNASAIIMKKTLIASVACLLVGFHALCLAHTIDTGTPNGDPVGAYAFDSNDYYAGQVAFAGAARIDDIFGHILGGTAGETFTIALYDDAPGHVPGNELFASTATFGVDGWNGVSGMTDWNVAAGLYWIAFEIGFGETLGTGSVTGALLDSGATSPLARTAFTAGGAYQATSVPLSFGLQVDALVVPEPASVALVFAGLGGLLAVARRRR